MNADQLNTAEHAGGEMKNPASSAVFVGSWDPRKSAQIRGEEVIPKPHL